MRLIDADKLKKHYAWWGNDGAEYRERKADFDVIVDLQPTVEPTKHGRNIADGKFGWGYENTSARIFLCSECGYGFDDIYLCNERDYPIEPNYCPNCGARMDETVETYTINAGEV